MRRRWLSALVLPLILASAALAAKPIPAAIPIEGMTWQGCAGHVRETLIAVKGVADVQPSVEEKLVRVKFDPDQTSVKALVRTINTKTSYRAREPKSSGKSGSGKS